MNKKERRLCQMKADIVQAVAHPIRLAIAECLRGGERCVCELAEAVDAERSNVSRHLALMLRAGVVACRKDGLMVYYSLRTPCLLNFLSCVDRVLREQLEENRALLARM